MPELSISTGGGDATIAGDLVGHDKAQRVSFDAADVAVLIERTRNLEHLIENMTAQIGRLSSDTMNIRTELAAERGRKTMLVIVVIVWPVIVGAIVQIVGILIR